MALRIQWNLAAFRELRTDPGIVADIEERASRIAAAAGDGHEVNVSTSGGRGRARASVVTATADAMRSESEDMTLTSAIDAGR